MISDERVQIALEELQDLKGVWNELLKVWEKIDELKEQPWLSVQPRKVSMDPILVYFMCLFPKVNVFVLLSSIPDCSFCLYFLPKFHIRKARP